MLDAVTIDRVEVLGDGARALADCGLSSPEAGESVVALGIEVKGWAVGRAAPVTAVELVCQGEVLRSVPMEAAGSSSGRDRDNGAPGRFFGVLGAVRLPPRFAFVVRARLEDGADVPFVEISGRRESLADAGSAEDLRAGFISTPTGRTGTT